jgi:hypothetical protein
MSPSQSVPIAYQSSRTNIQSRIQSPPIPQKPTLMLYRFMLESCIDSPFPLLVIDEDNSWEARSLNIQAQLECFDPLPYFGLVE